MEYNKQLAKISMAKLSTERNILSFWIFVDYEEGFSQGVGGIALDSPKKEKQPELDAVKIIFGFSNSKAKEALRVLNQEEIDSIVDAAEKLENPK